MIAFALLCALIIAALIGVYIFAEVHHYRKGNDVWEWTRKLVKWMDKK